MAEASLSSDRREIKSSPRHYIDIIALRKVSVVLIRRATGQGGNFKGRSVALQREIPPKASWRAGENNQ